MESRKPMTESSQNQKPAPKIRIHQKYHRLIFTGLMASLMSIIISGALILIKEGYSDAYFEHLISSWLLAFAFAWPSAYVCAYVIQTHILSRINFYTDQDQ